jgi:GT2 family glycosyltransferase
MISVVIPSYNRKDCILRLLRDLHAQTVAGFEIIVVDDCSPDDTVEAVRREFPEITLLVNEQNGGPCVSRNRGVMAARGEIIVGLDSDVSINDSELLAKVKKAFEERPAASGFAFRIFQPDGITEDTPRWWHPVPIELGKAREFETDYFSGTGYAFRRTSMVRAGLFPEILYMHYEEVELALRILDQGGTLLYRPDLSVVHHANPVSRRSEIKVFYKPRNQVLLALRCYPAGRGIRYLVPRLAYGLLQGMRHGTLRGWFRAMKSAMQLAPRCLQERSAVAGACWHRMDRMKDLASTAGADPCFSERSPVHLGHETPGTP